MAIIGIIVENPDSIQALNQLLHQFSPYIIGRMGIPRPEHEHHQRSGGRAPGAISTLSGRIGKLDGVSAKTAYAKAEKK